MPTRIASTTDVVTSNVYKTSLPSDLTPWSRFEHNTVRDGTYANIGMAGGIFGEKNSVNNCFTGGFAGTPRQGRGIVG